MKFEYGKAPITYTDGIPTFKAGEWPGIKCCKFHSYKRVIRPQNCGIIFNENEPPIPPKRKLLGRQGPSPEYVFRSSQRKIPIPGTEHIERHEGLRYIPFPSRDPIPRKERRHFFPYKAEMAREEAEKSKRMTNSNAVKNEFKLMNVIGFAKRPYANLTNTHLMGFRFTQDQFGQLKFVDAYDPKNMTMSQRRNYMREQRMEQNRNFSSDVRYVRNLNNWDKSHMPKEERNMEPTSNINVDNNNELPQVNEATTSNKKN